MWLADIVVTDSWVFGLGMFFLGQLAVAVGWGLRLNSQVSAMKGDLEHLTKQVADGLRPFDQQRERHEALDRRVVALEEQRKSDRALLENMDRKLDRIIEREDKHA